MADFAGERDLVEEHQRVTALYENMAFDLLSVGEHRHGTGAALSSPHRRGREESLFGKDVSHVFFDFGCRAVGRGAVWFV